MLELYKTELGSYLTNSYVIRSEEGQTAVVDVGAYTEEYEKFLYSIGVESVDLILLTHGHFDHICGVEPLKKRFGGEIVIHAADSKCLEGAEYSLADRTPDYVQYPVKADRMVFDGDEIMLGSTKFTVMHTPGHTKGSVVYICEDIMFSGDTLFRLSMGRTDLPGGSTKELFASLRQIGQMTGEYTIYPGHGEKSSLSYEKRNNRYLRAYDSLHG